MGICAGCKNAEASWAAPCAVVSRRAFYRPEGPADTLYIRQELIGYEHAGLCDQCAEKAYHSKLTEADSKISIALATLCVASAMIGAATNHVREGLIAAAVFFVLFLIAACIEMIPKYLRKRKKKNELRALLLADIIPYKGRVYVPLEKKLYSSLSQFRKSNPYLLGDISKAIYTELVETGKGEAGNTEGVAIEPDSGTRKDSELTAMAVEPSQKQNLDLANGLVSLFEKNPDGIAADSEDAKEVRKIGQRLHDAGGLKLMTVAHQVLSVAFEYKEENDVSENLANLWDGIGNWGK